MLKVLGKIRWRFIPFRYFATKKTVSKPRSVPEINTAMKNFQMEGVTIVRTKEMAQKVVQILYDNKDKICAWDTETIDIDAKEESPVGKGRVICASAFCGPEVNFGNGPSIFSFDNFRTLH